jgi:hypothetical protein
VEDYLTHDNLQSVPTAYFRISFFIRLEVKTKQTNKKKNNNKKKKQKNPKNLRPSKARNEREAAFPHRFEHLHST